MIESTEERLHRIIDNNSIDCLQPAVVVCVGGSSAITSLTLNRGSSATNHLCNRFNVLAFSLTRNMWMNNRSAVIAIMIDLCVENYMSVRFGKSYVRIYCYANHHF